jgi:hypothetical protein
LGLSQPSRGPIPKEILHAAFQRERLGPAALALFTIRRAVGVLLRLDRGSSGFVPVDTEAAERLLRIDNRTVSALLHFSLADRRPRLAVYVQPKGWLGRAYLWAIEPFRRYLVYPSLLAAGGRPATRLQAENP